MINQLFKLERPLFVLDCETTGTDTNVDRIVSIGFQRWEDIGKTMEWKALVDPGTPIPLESTAVHGITDAMVKACRSCGASLPIECQGHAFDPWPPFSVLAKALVRGFQDCDFAGKNVRFDLRIVAAEMRRAGVEWSYLGARVIDAERMEQVAVPRTLGDLYKKYTGEELDEAHDALADVKASTIVIVKQLETHADLPRDLQALHDKLWPGWIDPDGKFRFVNGVPCFGGWGKYAGKPMRAADNGYWDWILKADFPADVKKLAASAKLGKYPEVRSE